jgi:hypothetical protein
MLHFTGMDFRLQFCTCYIFLAGLSGGHNMGFDFLIGPVDTQPATPVSHSSVVQGDGAVSG